MHLQTLLRSDHAYHIIITVPMRFQLADSYGNSKTPNALIAYSRNTHLNLKLVRLDLNIQALDLFQVFAFI